MTRDDRRRSRVARWAGLVGLAVRRSVGRPGRGPRTGVAVAVVATTMALMLVVTGVSLGLASRSTVSGESADLWLAPESGSTLSAAVSVEGPHLGSAHAKRAAIARYAGVEYATPVLLRVLRMRVPGEPGAEYVLAVGVVPPPEPITVAGLSTAELSAGDPHYADGSYDGPFTGDAVLSSAAADLLGASAGESVLVANPGSDRQRRFDVAAVGDPGRGAVGGQLPVVVVRLSELQSVTGAADGDRADQVLVGTNAPGVRSRLARDYPNATVAARDEVAAARLGERDLPLAASVAAFLVGLAVNALFVTTVVGLLVESDRRTLATLAALGFPERARLALVLFTASVVTFAGAALSLPLAFLGIQAVNLAAGAYVPGAAVAAFHPVLVPYAFAVAVVTVALAAPYPLAIARRTSVLGELAG